MSNSNLYHNSNCEIEAEFGILGSQIRIFRVELGTIMFNSLPSPVYTNCGPIMHEFMILAYFSGTRVADFRCPRRHCSHTCICVYYRETLSFRVDGMVSADIKNRQDLNAYLGPRWFPWKPEDVHEPSMPRPFQRSRKFALPTLALTALFQRHWEAHRVILSWYPLHLTRSRSARRHPRVLEHLLVRGLR